MNLVQGAQTSPALPPTKNYNDAQVQLGALQSELLQGDITQEALAERLASIDGLCRRVRGQNQSSLLELRSRREEFLSKCAIPTLFAPTNVDFYTTLFEEQESAHAAIGSTLDALQVEINSMNGIMRAANARRIQQSLPLPEDVQ